MDIPDEAVEAAAKAVFEQVEVIQTPEYAAKIARLALAAAAPFIAADAWDEAHQEGRVDEWCLTPNPYRSQA